MLIERGQQQNAKMVVVGRNLRALKHAGKSGIFNAEKSVGGHVRKSITSRFSTESHFTWQLDVEHFRK